MSSALPLSPSEACCVEACEDVVVQQIPGPAGTDGENGEAGIDGVSAFTTLTSNFTMPAEGGTAVANVADSTWIVVNQLLYLQNAGWMRATAKPSSVQVTLRNEENTASALYTENVAPATVVASGSQLSPGGLQGPAGSLAGALLAANNLSDVANAATARSNLGLVIGTNVQAFNANLSTYAGIAPSANVQSILAAANYAAIRTLLTLVPGTDVQAFDAFLNSIASLGTVADRMIYTTAINTAAEAVLTSYARTLLDDATALDARTTLGKVLPRYGVIGSAGSVDHNVATTDNAITMEATRYRIDKVIVENASISLTTATAGVFTAAGGGGTTIAADQALSALTASTKYDDLTLQAVTGTDVFTSGTLYYRIGTPQGAAATANVWIVGWRLDT